MNAKRLKELRDELNRAVTEETESWEILGRTEDPILDCCLTWGELRDMANELHELGDIAEFESGK